MHETLRFALDFDYKLIQSRLINLLYCMIDGIDYIAGI